MKTTKLLPANLLVGALLFLSVPLASAQEIQAPAARVWVAVRIIDQPGQPPTEYYGTVDKEVLAGLTHSLSSAGMVELRQAAWYQGDKIESTAKPPAEGSTELDYGYDRTLYLRTTAIFRIFVLRDDFVKTHFEAKP